MENTNTENTELNNVATNEDGTERTYSQAEVADLLQRETDRRVSSALAKQKRDYEKQLSLSKLDGIERERAEKDATIADLQEKLAQFEIERNKSELKSVLSSRGLSAEFADLILITDSLEESQERIEKLDKLFKNAVAEEVKRRIATGTPQVGTSSGETTKEAFNKMTLKEKQELYRTNPELYKKFN